MSAEINFGVRLSNWDGTLKLLDQVAQQIAERLATFNHQASQLTLKVKIAVPGWQEPPKKGGHGRCEDCSRSTLLPKVTREASILLHHATQLLNGLSPDPSRIRGMGLSVRMDAKTAVSGQATLQHFFQANAGKGDELPTNTTDRAD